MQLIHILYQGGDRTYDFMELEKDIRWNIAPEMGRKQNRISFSFDEIDLCIQVYRIDILEAPIWDRIQIKKNIINTSPTMNSQLRSSRTEE